MKNTGYTEETKTERYGGRIIKTIILKATEPISIPDLYRIAEEYERMLYEPPKKLSEQFYSVPEQIRVIPLPCNLTLQTIEDGIDDFKLYVKDLNDIVKLLEKK